MKASKDFDEWLRSMDRAIGAYSVAALAALPVVVCLLVDLVAR